MVTYKDMFMYCPVITVIGETSFDIDVIEGRGCPFQFAFCKHLLHILKLLALC